MGCKASMVAVISQPTFKTLKRFIKSIEAGKSNKNAIVISIVRAFCLYVIVLYYFHSSVMYHPFLLPTANGLPLSSPVVAYR